jgi:hypothetical protein
VRPALLSYVVRRIEQMCWFIIDPKTGRHVRRVTRPAKKGADTLYVNDLASDALHDHAWQFHELLAEHSTRPPLEDLASFVIEGCVPASFQGLNQRKLKMHRAAFARSWAGIDQAYQEFLGRAATRQEKYWTAHSYLWRMAIGKDQFYANKTVRCEVWLLHDLELIGRGALTWARLRVFDDGTADVWDSTGLNGFDSEEMARRYLREGHYVEMETLGAMTPIPKGAKPPAAKANSRGEGFRYFGVW